MWVYVSMPPDKISHPPPKTYKFELTLLITIMYCSKKGATVTKLCIVSWFWRFVSKIVSPVNKQKHRQTSTACLYVRLFFLDVPYEILCGDVTLTRTQYKVCLYYTATTLFWWSTRLCEGSEIIEARIIASLSVNANDKSRVHLKGSANNRTNSHPLSQRSETTNETL